MGLSIGTINAGATVFGAPGVPPSATELNAMLPYPVATFNNLRCVASVAITGTTPNIVVTLRTGTCGGVLVNSALTSTVSGTTSVLGTGAVATTVGQCVSIGAVANASITNVAGTINVSCTVQVTQ